MSVNSRDSRDPQDSYARGCLSKVGHPTRESAEDSRARQGKLYYAPHSYLCPRCDLWHLGGTYEVPVAVDNPS